MTYWNTKFHGPTLTGISFVSTTEVIMPYILEQLKLQDQEVWCQGQLQWHDLHAKFNENLPTVSKVIRTH
jgi:hypothetical protein